MTIVTTVTTIAATFIFGSGGSLLLTYILGKRKERAEIGRIKAETGKTTAQVTMEFVEQLMRKIAESDKKNENLELRVSLLEKQSIDKDREIMNLRFELEKTINYNIK